MPAAPSVSTTILGTLTTGCSLGPLNGVACSVAFHWYSLSTALPGLAFFILCSNNLKEKAFSGLDCLPSDLLCKLTAFSFSSQLNTMADSENGSYRLS